jgi:2,3-dimethylmalate lyase
VGNHSLGQNARFADADTGFGNAVNVQRTVREYEAAGAAGLHLEDQEFPKKCGFMQGKCVVDLEDHSQKIRAACEARTDPNFVIIGRTDALAPHGWDEVVRRAHAYREAGADLIMVDGVRKPDASAYIERLVRKGVPCVFNSELPLSSEEAAEAGFKFQIVGAGFLGAYNGMFRALAEARRGGVRPPTDVPVVTDILGLQEIYEIEAKYAGRELPKSTAFEV